MQVLPDPVPQYDEAFTENGPETRNPLVGAMNEETTQSGSTSSGVDAQLAQQAGGTVVRTVPVVKDCTILAYKPDWDFGNVDNIAIENGGGVRVLIDWGAIPAAEVGSPDLRFILALYSRRTQSNPPTGPIHAFEIVEGWRKGPHGKRCQSTIPSPWAPIRWSSVMAGSSLTLPHSFTIA